MNSEPMVLNETDVTRAWAKLAMRLLEPGVTELLPVMVTVDLPDGIPVETPAIRDVADEFLARYDKPLSGTTASTIFPSSFWSPGDDRQKLYRRYKRLLPRLRSHRRNQHGLYFERLIGHGATEINQLEHIITTWQGGNHRRSALQASILDPARDHTDQRQRGFPCLQQVMFAPGDDGLTVMGFYGVQHIFDRALGNYLGLCRLGQFMAHEMELPLVRLLCTTGIAKLGTPSKSELNEMKERLQPHMGSGRVEVPSLPKVRQSNAKHQNVSRRKIGSKKASLSSAMP